MPFNTIDGIATPNPARDLGGTHCSSRPDRRRRTRTSLRCHLLLSMGNGVAAIETVTENLSSTGFYCLSPKPAIPGETLLCTLRIPAHHPSDHDESIRLECSAVVVRTESAHDGFFGIACSIKDYRIVRFTGSQRQ